MKKLLLIAFILPFFATFSQTETVVVTSKGTSLSEAKASAQRAALEQVMGTTILSSSSVEDMMITKDAILTKSEGYIKSSKVLEEGKGKDGLFFVKLEAEVSKSALEADAKNLAQQLGGLRFLVLYDPRQHNTNELAYYDYTYERMNEKLADKKYRYIEKSRFDELKEESFKILDEKKDKSEATFIQKLGFFADAQFLIFVKDIQITTREMTVAGTKLYASSARLDVKSYDNCTAEGLGTVEMLTPEEVMLPDLKDSWKTAIREAIHAGSEKLFYHFTNYAGEWINTGSPYEIRFYDICEDPFELYPLYESFEKDPLFGGQFEPVGLDGYAKFVCTYREVPFKFGYKVLNILKGMDVAKGKDVKSVYIYGRQISYAPKDKIVPEAEQKKNIGEKLKQK